METVLWVLSKIDLTAILDILLVAGLIYGVLLMVRGTQAVQLLRGVILLALVMALLGSILDLTAFKWILDRASQALLVVIVIVLQPELRRSLDRLGRGGRLSLWGAPKVEMGDVIRQIVLACSAMSKRRHGALIVIERNTFLAGQIETGVKMDAEVIDELLQTIFFPNTALHDGAVIVRRGRIVAAACVLPLAETITEEGHMGTRHRAAIGVTEQTDAISVVVSEETGIISMAQNGNIVRRMDERRLAAMLTEMLVPAETEQSNWRFWRRWRRDSE